METAKMLGKGFAELSGWIVKVAEWCRHVWRAPRHIADGSNYYCARVTGKKVEWSDANAPRQD